MAPPCSFAMEPSLRAISASYQSAGKLGVELSLGLTVSTTLRMLHARLVTPVLPSLSPIQFTCIRVGLRRLRTTMLVSRIPGLQRQGSTPGSCPPGMDVSTRLTRPGRLGRRDSESKKL